MHQTKAQAWSVRVKRVRGCSSAVLGVQKPWMQAQSSTGCDSGDGCDLMPEKAVA